MLFVNICILQCSSVFFCNAETHCSQREIPKMVVWDIGMQQCLLCTHLPHQDPPLSSGEQCRRWSVARLGRHQTTKQFREEIGNSSCSDCTSENDCTQPLYTPKIPGKLISPKIHAESSNFTPRIFFEFNM